jgi:uncharacterized membrane protein YqhA
MGSLERTFERALSQSRLLVVVAVVASAFLALGAFYMATVDVVVLIGNLLPYASPALDPTARKALREATVVGIVKAVDGYLIAAIVLIFALGLYELFVKKIAPSESAVRTMPRLIPVESLDDLKDRMARLILLVLIIEFFQYALKLTYANALDLVYLSIGILFIGGALYLSGPGGLRGRKD